MKKKYSGIVEDNCFKCPFCSSDEILKPCCVKANKIIEFPLTIPSWCPLEDADETEQPEKEC